VLVITVTGVVEKTTMIEKYAISLALNLLPGRCEIISEKRLKIEMAKTIINADGIVKKTIKFSRPGISPL
jgi:hypothetical protein